MKALPREDSCERSNCSILSTDSKDGATSQDSIIHSGCKGLTFCLLYRHATLSPKKKKKYSSYRSPAHKCQISCLSPVQTDAQHCWPTTPNIVGCFMLCPFAQPVACCCALLRVVAQSLKRDKCLAGQQCWEFSSPFAFLFSLFSSRNCLPFTCACAQSTTFSSC